MPPPVSDAAHTEDFEQMAALAALQLLEGDELAAFNAHAATCQRCQVMLEQDRLTVARLAVAAPEMDASPGFKSRLLERAAAELEADQAPPEPIPLEPRRLAPVTPLPFWRRHTWAMPLAAAFVFLIGAGVVLATMAYSNQVVATVALAGPGPGTGTLVLRRSGEAELQLQVPSDPPPGFVYEAWIIPPNQAPIPAGVTDQGDGSIQLEGGPLRGSTVAVTLERAPGATQPQTPPFLLGTVDA